MIGYLRGKRLRLTAEKLLLDVGGVGYELHIPLSTWAEIDRAGGEPIGLHVYTHVSENALELYGFWDEGERRLFERLIGVSGIGPKLARVVLSGMAPADLIGAIATGNTTQLTSIPGVGKKTAERMVVDLKDRIAELGAAPEAIASAGGDDDVTAALVNLGYREKEAQQAVAKARTDNPEGEFEELIRASLRLLSRA